MDELFREPEPAGALNPPIRRPPTARGLATPPAPLPARRRPVFRRRSLLDRVRATALVLLDVADGIAELVTRRISTP